MSSFLRSFSTSVKLVNITSANGFYLTQVATLQEGDEECDLEPLWQQCTDRMTVKSITADDHGHVSLAWQSTGSTEDDGMSLLDDIWETKMPTASGSKGSNKRPKPIADEDEGGNKRGKQSSALSSSGETQPAAKRVKVSKTTAGKQTSAASLIRSLNGCDTLLLEAQETLDMFAADETFSSVPVASITKQVDKIDAKLTAQSVEFLQQGWEPGQPENRGCQLVSKMRSTLASLALAKNLALSLQAKPGSEDLGSDKNVGCGPPIAVE